MRYRMFLLLSIVSVGVLGMTTPAPSGYNTNTYNLQRTEISGVVQSINGQEAYILTDDGQEIGVLLGPQAYWDERGYHLQEGDYVEMDIWHDPYEYTDWYFAGEVWGNGFHFVLTNSYGVPHWVVPEQDYYYGLGYRASCVSYMVWFDCPPFYFVSLAWLPPPPPLYYTCYYGPRWRTYCSDWYYSPRYCSGGSYWDDGRGYERPRYGRRINGYADGGSGGGSYNPGYDDNDRIYNREPVLTPKQNSPSRPQPRSKFNSSREKSKAQNGYKQQERKEFKPLQSQKQTLKSSPRQEQKSQRKVTSPRNEQKSQRKMVSSQKERKYQQRTPSARQEHRVEKRSSAPVKERKMQANKSAPRERQYADRSVKPQVREQKSQVRSGKPQVREQKSQVRSGKAQVREQKSQGRTSKPQVREQKGSTQERQYNRPQSSKQSSKQQSTKRSGGRNLDRRDRNR